jgi:uncharacterized membrane protein YoaK (UPF0700 family)
MLTKPIPRWILGGGALLAACAGCINVVGLLSAQHQTISHLTGTTSLLGLEIMQANWTMTGHVAAVFGSFFAGCVGSGLIIRHKELRSGYPYGIALMFECGLLVTACYLLRHESMDGAYFAAMACGLQNGMATTYSGAVIRTTHVTGIVTDLGIALGQLARREQIDRRRMGLYLILFGAFFLGASGGTAGFRFFGYDVLLIPAFFTGAAGVSYFLFTKRTVHT